MAATAFIGFAPTFWVPLAQGVPERIAVLAIHGALFFGWTLFVIYQAWLVESGSVARHRDVGLFGVSLATAMTIFGVLAAINAAQRATAAHYAGPGESFMVVPLAALLSFAVLVTAAILNIRRSEWHKRLMLSATAVLLDAAIARPFIVYLVMGGHPPPFRGTVGLAGFQHPATARHRRAAARARSPCSSSSSAWFAIGARSAKCIPPIGGPAGLRSRCSC